MYLYNIDITHIISHMCKFRYKHTHTQTLTHHITCVLTDGSCLGQGQWTYLIFFIVGIGSFIYLSFLFSALFSYMYIYFLHMFVSADRQQHFVCVLVEWWLKRRPMTFWLVKPFLFLLVFVVVTRRVIFERKVNCFFKLFLF